MEGVGGKKVIWGTRHLLRLTYEQQSINRKETVCREAETSRERRERRYGNEYIGKEGRAALTELVV